MDPLSIAASSFGIVGAIAKASIAILEFSQQAKDAAEDLQGMSRELQALSAILDPLARNVSCAPQGTVPAALSQQLVLSLDGCALVVSRIDTAVEKYQKDGPWTRTKWVMFGRGDVEKLRGSLETYKMALSLGLHVVSMAVEASIKDDTGAIRRETRALRHDTAAIQVNTEEILARVMSIRNGTGADGGSRTRQWVDSMAVLSSYAESSYQETTINPGDGGDFGANDVAFDTETVRGAVPALDQIPELGSLEFSGGEETVKGTTLSSGFNGNATRGGTSTSTTVAVLQRHIETKNPVGPSSAPDTGHIQRRPLESREGTDATSHNAGRTTVQPTTIKNGTLDVVVALDIGGTSAAVAWMTQNKPAQVIREWPGGMGSRVPMRVVYDEKSENETVARWGFQCAEASEARTPYFDVSFTAFLRQLYAYIRQTIVTNMHLQLSDWAEMGVEFHVTHEDLSRGSTPQTWSQQIEKLKGQLRRSGIGTGGPRHCAVLGLTKTEAEATSVLLCLPASILPEHIIMLKIGLGKATILRTERSHTVATIHSVYSLHTPKLSSHIQELVSTWLEKYPEICESLGPNGLGGLVQDSMYQDVLHGSAPLREFYRLRFDGLPESFSHAAFDIKEGTIRLTRSQVEHIFDSLVHRISNLVINALVDGRTNLQSAQMLRRIIALEVPDTPRYLAKRIMDGLEQRPAIASAAYRAARRDNADMVPDTALEEGVGLNITAAPLTILGDRAVAAVEGLLVHRNAWNFRLGPQIGFNLVPPLRVCAKARAYNPWAPSSVCFVSRTDVSETDPWLHPMAPITQHWRVSDHDYDTRHSKHFSLDLYYTLDNQWCVTDPWDLTKLTKLCTVVWLLSPRAFQSRTFMRRWWGRAVKSWTLEFAVQFCMLQSSNTGPRFELLVPNQHAKLPKSVQWHCELPFAVCPAESGQE